MTAEVPAWTVPGVRSPDAESKTDDIGRRWDGRRSTLVWDVLRAVLDARVAETGRQTLDIVDAGGGTGGFAVPFAELGHNVTVVDLSPDALASAQRRAAERKVPLAAVQGEADGLDALVGTEAADLVICHSVLEYVDSPAATMAAIARVLRPGATVSVLAANTVAAVLQRVLAGRYSDAGQLLDAARAQDDVSDNSKTGVVVAPAADNSNRRLAGDRGRAGNAGSAGPGEPRRFTLAGLAALIEGAGLSAGDAHGIRVFSGLLPAADPDPGAAEALRSLEDAAATYPALRDIAARLHMLGVK